MKRNAAVPGRTEPAERPG